MVDDTSASSSQTTKFYRMAAGENESRSIPERETSLENVYSSSWVDVKKPATPANESPPPKIPETVI